MCVIIQAKMDEHIHKEAHSIETQLKLATVQAENQSPSTLLGHCVSPRSRFPFLARRTIGQNTQKAPRTCMYMHVNTNDVGVSIKAAKLCVQIRTLASLNRKVHMLHIFFAYFFHSGEVKLPNSIFCKNLV